MRGLKTPVLVLAIAVLSLLIGCAPRTGSAPFTEKDKPTPAAPVAGMAHDTTTKATAASQPIAAAIGEVKNLTPANVNEKKWVILEILERAAAFVADTIKSALATESRAKESDAGSAKLLKQAADAQTKANEEYALRVKAEELVKTIQKDATTRTLQIGIGLCFIPMILGVLVCRINMGIGLALVAGGACAMALGIVAMAFTGFVFQHETAIGIGILIAAPVMIAGGLYLAYLKLHHDDLSVLKANQAGILTGATDFGAQANINRAVLTPGAKKRVAKLTSKADRERASDLNGAANVRRAA